MKAIACFYFLNCCAIIFFFLILIKPSLVSLYISVLCYTEITAYQKKRSRQLGKYIVLYLAAIKKSAACKYSRNIGTSKGQLISKCLYEIIVWTKIPTKFLIISALALSGQKLSNLSLVFWSKR